MLYFLNYQDKQKTKPKEPRTGGSRLVTVLGCQGSANLGCPIKTNSENKREERTFQVSFNNKASVIDPGKNWRTLQATGLVFDSEHIEYKRGRIGNYLILLQNVLHIIMSHYLNCPEPLYH